MSEYRLPVRDSAELRGARDLNSRRDFISQRPGPYMDVLDYPMGRDYGRLLSRDYAPPVTGRRYSPEMRRVTVSHLDSSGL